jgi:mRNA-degrading endonuclease toxin of MazEF toxin-antitoxin module
MTENALFAVASAHPSDFEAYTIRPCFIVQPNPTIKERILTSFPSMTCRVDELAMAMLEVAKNGNKDKIVEKDEIRSVASRLIASKEGKVPAE